MIPPPPGPAPLGRQILGPGRAAMGEVIALADQVMVPLATEQLYPFHSRMVTALLPVMQAWRIHRYPSAQSSKRLPGTISQAPRKPALQPVEV